MCGDAAPADDGREPACVKRRLHSLVDGNFEGVPYTVYQVLYHVSYIFKWQGTMLVMPMSSFLSSVTIISILEKPFCCVFEQLVSKQSHEASYRS